MAAQYSDPYEEWKQGGRKGSAPGSPNFPAAPTSAPAAPTPSGVTGRGGAPAPAPAGLGDLSGFRDYGAWQAANRGEGGSGHNTAVQAYFQGLSGGGATAPAGGIPGTPGTGSDAAVSQANAAYASGQRGSDPNAIFGPGGAAAYRQAYGAAQGGNRPEDLARFSDETLAGWDQYMVKDGPNAGKYRSMRGAPGFFDKPTECPPGQVPSGPDETDPCTSADGGGGGGGGGAAGGGAGAGAGAPAPSGGGDTSGLGSMMETNLKKMLAGGDSRYSPQAMQGLLAQIKQNVESQRKTQLRQSGEEAAARGMSRSGQTGVDAAKINAASGASFTNQYAGVLKAKIDADRQDKLDALDRSQKYLDSLRDELYRRDMSANQRQQFQANLDLAYANLANQRQQFASSQQHQRDMLGAQYGYQATFGGL